MSKKKTSTDDFLRLLDDEETSSQPVAFSPAITEHSSNLVQTSVKSSSEHSSNLVQTSVKSSSKLLDKTTSKQQMSFKPSSKSGAFIVQTSVKSSSNLVQKFDFHMLSPIQQKLLILLYEEGQISRSKISPPLNGALLAKRLESSLEGLRTAVKRLVKADFLLIAEAKSGRTGWTRYELPEWVYQQMTLNETWFKSGSNLVQMSFKPSSKPSSEPSSELPYSSSNNLNINTNTIAAEILSIPENLRRFGISPTNLQNLINSGKATQDVVERSLAALSFDVEHGKTGNLANILFGVLGTGREYISQKYSETLQKELDAELARIQQAEESQKKLAETKLQIQFREFLTENPNFLEEVREKHKGFVKTQDLLEKMAFEEFKSLPNSI
ncbi:hypothetical protein [Bdellovibrio sp.]|uniref:hypothetical protein n=1 Tax=Bdellovibrio sp. TaxID=28201 RepID=UPI0032214DC8